MFTVAIIGPDGVGKTTVSRQLEHTLSLRAKYVYMGVNLESSNLVLPTTRLLLELKRARGGRPDMAGPPDPTKVKPRPKGIVRRTASGIKSTLRLVNQVAEERFRQLVVRYYLLRGYVVLFDRDFFADYYAHDIGRSAKGRPLTSRIHGFLLERFYRRPDLVICLDAPPEVMFARKGEGTLELLESRRQEYLRLRGTVQRFDLVDATQPLGDVIAEVSHRIHDFSETFGKQKRFARC
ncbi:unnamed protein product [marine sediment metagenome]|uniref:Thymidylate kinase-like domain-containing protein n=1 Tax=marine sediment metagenome TaxID=412755 RepID=X0S4L4_9ZZZZ